MENTAFLKRSGENELSLQLFDGRIFKLDLKLYNISNTDEFFDKLRENLDRGMFDMIIRMGLRPMQKFQ